MYPAIARTANQAGCITREANKELGKCSLLSRDDTKNVENKLTDYEPTILCLNRIGQRDKALRRPAGCLEVRLGK